MSIKISEATKMKGKFFQSDMNNPDEMSVKVMWIERNGGGHSVFFKNINDGSVTKSLALGRFIKKYPHEIKDQP
jgi:hypothetical protein